ncbi:MAG: 50S ribosomal protein L6 [archaeon]
MFPKERLRKEIEIPEGVQVIIDGKTVKVIGPVGEVQRILAYPTLEIKIEGNKVMFEPKVFSKKEKMIINTFVAHVNNMIQGTQEPFVYKLKIASSHFPMNVTLQGKEVVIKNFFGEKIPRRARIMEGVKVEISGDIITVTANNREAAGQTAANLEQSTRITNRDRRVFQDGIWITEKAGKQM